MSQTLSPVHDKVRKLLAGHGLPPAFGREDSLFVSGRLDSLAATEILLLLESEYGVDLADADFDMASLDTIADIERLVQRHQAA
jgi:acyl carrier protein